MKMDFAGPFLTVLLVGIVLAGHCAHARNFKSTRERRSVPYKVQVITGTQQGAGTDANVFLKIFGANGQTTEKKLSNTFENNFEKGKMDTFNLPLIDLGKIQKIMIRHDNFGFMPAWNLDRIKIIAPDGQVYEFSCGCQLKQGALSKELFPAGKQTGRVGTAVGGGNGLFKDASHCWPFNEAQANSSPDLTGNFPAQLKDEARIVDSVARGKVASTLEENSWIDFGNFKGRCISDPTLCVAGVTMMFWARIEQSAVTNNPQLPKYMLSSGGADLRSRGFSLFTQNNAFVLRVVGAQMKWRIQIPQGGIPLNSWFSFAFTWKREEGLRYYVNGQEAGIKHDGENLGGGGSGNEFNDLRISKPNHNNLVQEMLPMKFDQFATWNRILQPNEIKQAFDQGGGLPGNERQANPQACQPNPCQNGGTCKPDPDSPEGYRCVCPPQYAGVKCEINEDLQGTPTASTTGASTTVTPTTGTTASGATFTSATSSGTTGTTRTPARGATSTTSSGTTGTTRTPASGATSTTSSGTTGTTRTPTSSSSTATGSPSGSTTRGVTPTSATSSRTTGSSGGPTSSTPTSTGSPSGSTNSGVTKSSTTSGASGTSTNTAPTSSPATSSSSPGVTGTPTGSTSSTTGTTATPPQGPLPNLELLTKDLSKQMNVFRRLHKSPDVAIAEELNQAAGKWAQTLAASGEEKIDPDSQFGQLVCSHHSEGDIAMACAVKWYSAVKFYDWADPKLTVQNSPFTQLVWKASTSMGVGIAKGGPSVRRAAVPGKYFIVVNLEPAQSDDKIKENVLPAEGSSQPAPEAACPEGYFRPPMGSTKSCFAVRNTPVTWDDALLGCALDHAGNLASLESREQADLIVSLLTKSNLTEAWIGLHDRSNEGRYVWVSGAPIPFSEWLPGEPDGNEAENCIVQAKGEYGPGWADRKCTARKAFVCEVKAPGYTFYKFTFNLTEQQTQSYQYPMYPQSVYSGSYYPTCTPVIQNVNDILRETITRYFQAKNITVQPVVNTIRCMPNGKSTVQVTLRLGPGDSPDSIESLKTSIKENDGELELENGASAKLVSATILMPDSAFCPNQCESTTCQPGCDPHCCAQAPATPTAFQYPSPVSYQPVPIYPDRNPWQCPIACSRNVNYCPPYCSSNCCRNKRRSRVKIHKF